jgi:ribosomal protein S18 acetylase RimI-like enzyme
MSDESTYQVQGGRQLTAEQAKAARALREICNRADGLDLKLGIAADFTPQSSEPYAFLCEVDGELVGFCTLVGDDEPELELCGMVHPAHRRQGIGRALLRAALDSAGRRPAATRILAICEDTSAAGRAFVAAAGGTHAFSEHRMETSTRPAPSDTAKRLDVRESTAADAGDLARIIAMSFGQTDDPTSEMIVANIAAGERYFLARRGTEPVGAFKVFIDPPKAYIYAFGVLPGQRRYGYGREILEDILPRLFAEGWTAVGLEVDADNLPAQALYRAVGFHDVTVYGYYALPPANSADQ